MIQFGEIAEVMFQLCSHYESQIGDYGLSCSAKSPNGSIKLKYFPDCSCLGMALQKSLEEGPGLEGFKADNPIDYCCIHSEWFKS